MSILLDILRNFKAKSKDVTKDNAEPVNFPNVDMVLSCDEDYFEQSSSPHNSDPLESQAIKQKGYTMKIKKGTKRITVLQYLISKFVWDQDGLHLDEYIAMYELFLLLSSEQKDLNFVNKYSESFGKTELLIKKITQPQFFPLKMKNSIEDRKVIAHFLGNLCLSPDAYFGMRGNRNIRDSFRIKINYYVEPQSLPPKRFIGVGYKDKGTCRIPSFDGSPRWQEVAQEYCELEEAFSNLFYGSEESSTGDDGHFSD